MKEILEINANIDLVSDGGRPIPTEESANLLLVKFDQLGFTRNELLFSGFKDLSKDMTKIDKTKIADKSLEEDGRRELLNTREIELHRFQSELESKFPDPLVEIKELRLTATDYYNRGNFDAVERIKNKLAKLEAKKQERLEKRREFEDAFEYNVQDIVDRPVYFCGDSETLTIMNGEDNPFSYAVNTIGDTSFGTGYLAVYSKLALKEAGAEIRYLADVSDRTDHQVLVSAEHTIMMAGQLSLVHCEFEFIG